MLRSDTNQDGNTDTNGHQNRGFYHEGDNHDEGDHDCDQDHDRHHGKFAFFTFLFIKSELNPCCTDQDRSHHCHANPDSD